MRLLILLIIFSSSLAYGQSSSRTFYNQRLSDSIVKMGLLDQTAAGMPVKGMNWDEFSIYKDSIFHLNYNQIRRIFNSYGYLGYNEIGESAETSFWVIIQHCDFAPEFQSQVLDSMKLEISNKNANPKHYGLLYDRVHLNIDEKQLYGTQVRYNQNTGQAYPKPLSDSINVNNRRKELGFESLEKYLNVMTLRHYDMNKQTLNDRGVFEPKLYDENQLNIAITIDDVPNTRNYLSNNFHSGLLSQLDSLNIPVTIFINEGLLYKTDSINKNIDLLEKWSKRDYVTLGNHTFSHSRYSEVGYDQFVIDIEKGEILLKEFSYKFHKPLIHFRFPYNDLGIDSLQHLKIDSILKVKNYKSSPFTIESSDWMFNYIYEYYLSQSKSEKAKDIGQLYVSKTIDYIHFFDSLSNEKYGRSINQIYLCHDNTLNADYLNEIILELKKNEFTFISIDEALTDSVYQQENNYYKKWGISWLYRWMPTQSERFKWMYLEPDISSIELLYQNLSKKNK